MEGYKLSSRRTAYVSSEIRETSYTVGELALSETTESLRASQDPWCVVLGTRSLRRSSVKQRSLGKGESYLLAPVSNTMPSGCLE